jgi:hypothetical protein
MGLGSVTATVLRDGRRTVNLLSRIVYMSTLYEDCLSSVLIKNAIH